MNDQPNGIVAAIGLTAGMLIGFIIGTNTADRNIQQITQCAEEPDWCRVEAPEMYQAISRPGSEGGE